VKVDVTVSEGVQALVVPSAHVPCHRNPLRKAGIQHCELASPEAIIAKAEPSKTVFGVRVDPRVVEDNVGAEGSQSSREPLLQDRDVLRIGGAVGEGDVGVGSLFPEGEVAAAARSQGKAVALDISGTFPIHTNLIQKQSGWCLCVCARARVYQTE